MNPVRSYWFNWLNRGTQQIFEDGDSEDDIEEIPYSVLERYNVRIILTYKTRNIFCRLSGQGYEKRYYPAATFVCNNVTDIDTAADPLAGLDNMNPFEIMGTKRYKKRHQSQMFMELFRYIAGVNQVDTDLMMTLK